MTGALEIRQLSSGYWHIRGLGPCNWAQPPVWPCDPEALDEHTFEEAGQPFRDALRRANYEALGLNEWGEVLEES